MGLKTWTEGHHDFEPGVCFLKRNNVRRGPGNAPHSDLRNTKRKRIKSHEGEALEKKRSKSGQNVDSPPKKDLPKYARTEIRECSKIAPPPPRKLL